MADRIPNGASATGPASPAQGTGDGRPIILLDVDGVLNAVCRDADLPDHWPAWCSDDAEGFTIRWAPEMIRRLLDLHDSGRAEIRWLTTWWNDVEHLAFLGLPTDLVVACTHEDHYGAHIGIRWWKLPVAQRVYAEGRPLVWIDDDITYDRAAKEWIDTLNDRRFLGVCPASNTGITPPQMDAINAFCASFAVGAS